MNRFQKWAVATTLATYLLILVGGLVRASDAGLGCPDWPTCFGKPYPPFTMSEFYERDIPPEFDSANFHVSLAWIEYINRFTGSIIGLLVLGTVFFAFQDHRHHPPIFYPSLGALVTVLLNGWLGSQVVESQLNPWIITTHLMLAWVQVSLLLVATVSAFYVTLPTLTPERKILARGTLLVLGLVLVQALLGTNVRGNLEVIEDEHPELARGEWIHEVGVFDYVHRSFSWLIILGVGWLMYYAHQKSDYADYLRYGTQTSALLVLLQVTAGIGLAYMNLPPPLQVIHLVLGTLLIGNLTLVYLWATRLPIGESRPAHLRGELNASQTH